MPAHVVRVSITCPVCREPTYDLFEVGEGYCPFCRSFTRADGLEQGIFVVWSCMDPGCPFSISVPAVDLWSPQRRRRFVEALDVHMVNDILIRHSHHHMPMSSLTMRVVRTNPV